MTGFKSFSSVRINETEYRIGTDKATFEGIECRTEPVYYGNAVEWTLRIKNTAETNSPQIRDFCGLNIDIPCKNTDFAEVNTLRGDNDSSESFIPVTKRLYYTDRYKIHSYRGRSSDTEAFPFFDITVADKTYVFGIGWSGCWELIILRHSDRISVIADLPGADFYLYPGEEARSARILMYCGGDSVEESRYRFREVLRDNIAPENVRMPISSHVFDRYYWNNTLGFRTEAAQLKIAENSAKIKNIDTFWLDAAWFKDAFPTGVGNYSFEPGFPDGLTALSEKVHSLGMRFMVWFEPERIHCGSETYRKYGNDKKFILDKHDNPENKMLNLGYKPAFDYLYKTISDFIRKYKIDIFRVDHNFDTAPYWEENDEPGRRGMTQMRSVEGLYAFWDRILTEFPGIMIDDCSSGGRRIDLETMARSVSCWRSDTGCAPGDENRNKPVWSQCVSVWLSRYIPYHQTVGWEPECYLIRSGMGEGIACAFDLMNDGFNVAEADRKLDEVRALARYRRGRTIPLTEVNHDDTVWFAYELQLEDTGCAFAFRRDNCEENGFVIRPVIKNPDRDYSVIIRDENCETTCLKMNGRELEKGILLNSGKPGESFSVEWKAE